MNAKIACLFILSLGVQISTQNKSSKYLISNQKVPFHEAYLRCRQYGLDPVEITSEEEQLEVEEAIKHDKELGWENGFYIFATNLGNKISYYWLNTGRPLFYSKFGTGLPNNVGNKENCLQIFQTTLGNFVWNDVPCEHKLRFICQHKIQIPIDTFDVNRVSIL
ncbi:salivary C-type lectin 2-like isoform X1 [Rhynchophorus ferrugineus]|uniref:salivary C-type lectin 2-like isoform X1 n=1 Tax=Rhynchophorus ferrugineus TaxID=354439 RepID=UPI003FCD2D58